MLISAGDYLVVLPTNPAQVIKRVIAKFGLNPDDIITITGTNKSFLVCEHIVCNRDCMLIVSSPAMVRQQ
jgi:sulfite reductase alpha subunit-like flavoprotein